MSSIFCFLIVIMSTPSFGYENTYEEYERSKYETFSTENNKFIKIQQENEEEREGGAVTAEIAKPTYSETIVLTPPQKMNASSESSFSSSQGIHSKSQKKNEVSGVNSSLGFTKEEHEEYEKTIQKVKDKYPEGKVTDEYIKEVFSEIEKVQNKNKSKLKQ